MGYTALWRKYVTFDVERDITWSSDLLFSVTPLMSTASLFPTENVSGGKRGQIERLQDRAAQELRLHVDDTYPDSPDRFSRLLLKLPTLKALQPQVQQVLAPCVVLWKSILVLIHYITI